MSSQLDEMARQCDIAWRALGDVAASGVLPTETAARIAEAARTGLCLAGSGDSAVAAEQVAVRSGRDLTVARPPELLRDSTHQGVVVGISASGNNPRLAEGLDRQRRHGALTVSATCRPDSPLAQAADLPVVVDLPPLDRSPAVLTYLATLLALDTLAAPAGATSLAGALSGAEPAGLQAAAERVTDQLPVSGELVVVAPVAGLPVARYLANKLIEVSGRTVVVSGVDDWIHIQRFATDPANPVIVWGLSPDPGGDLGAAWERLGRGQFSSISVVTGPAPTVGESVSVDLYGAPPELAGPLLAARIAVALGRRDGSEPFSGVVRRDA